MRYLSVCSGIEAATVAWHPMGWQPVSFAEIEKHPSAVLAHHYPHVPNLGDMTKFKEWPDVRPDILVGGTPCQSFSVAGLRKGMADPRGNLALTYLAIADQYRPEWLLWENVPGVLSSNGGRDFGAFLGGMVELGYGFAYRVLDAQYVRVDGFGRAVPQRRRRVFVVGNSRDWRRAAAVLFERESLSGNSAPRRRAGQRVAPTISARPTGGGGLGTDFDLDGGLLAYGGGNTSGPNDAAACLTAKGQRIDFEVETFVAGHAPAVSASNPYGDHESREGLLVAHSLRGEGFDASEDGTGRGTPLVPVSFAIQAGALRENPDSGPDGVGVQTDHAYTLEARPEVQAIAFDCKASGQSGFGVGDVASTMRAMGHHNTHQNGGGHQAVAFSVSENANGFAWEGDVNPTLQSRAQSPAANQFDGIRQGWAVRRLTPTECERLQGFPDGYTNVPWRGKNGSPDGPRYKALGNSMAVNAMRWIGRRIEAVSVIGDQHATNGDI